MSQKMARNVPVGEMCLSQTCFCDRRVRKVPVPNAVLLLLSCLSKSISEAITNV